jgi:hypothetical protein
MQKICFLFLAAVLFLNCIGCSRIDESVIIASPESGQAVNGDSQDTLERDSEAIRFSLIDRTEREVLEVIVEYGDAPIKIENCDFTDDGNADDILYIIPTKLVPGQYGDDYVELWAVLCDGSEASVILDEKFSADEPHINIHYRMDIFIADLDGGGDRIIVGNTSTTSTYWAADVFVFQVADNEFHRLLTVLDTISAKKPEEIKKYEDSLFAIPELAGCFGMPEKYRRLDLGLGSSVCSGVFVPNKYADYNRRDILILHLQKFGVPYTVLSWDGAQWTVVKQAWAEGDEDGFYLSSGQYNLDYDY